MSKTIDERVVSMQFDNSRFEKNVATTMSTLDKLKSKLSFKGATKGLEDVNTAAKRVDMNGLGRSVEAVGTKFSALQVMGVTALANITNSAVNAGKRIISALTIDPVKTGLSEFETKMNAIQVIQANTRGKNTMDDITAALDDLNEYADKTIYNFAQMTSNVGKFTAQGFDVKEASNAVKGLANLAAASGASAEDMARATYQMSQAMGSSIKLMDWNSLRNANMATQDLKDTLIALAKTHGIAIDEMIEDEGTFEYTLQNGWLTGEMFTEAMNIYSGVYSDAELKAKGFTDSQIKNFKDLAATAESAATEVKTFSQLWDVLKETAQSGWTQTWELIFGDFDTAKGMFTKMQVYLSDIINGWSNARNFVLEGILQFSKPWTAIMDKLEGAGLGNIKKVAETVGNVTEKLEHFQDIVNKVWRGDYGNSDTGRYELLEKAGYDHRVVQDLVNKGYQYKLTMKDVEESHKKFGLTMDKTTESTKGATDSILNLSDAQLKKAGLTEEEIRLYRDLAKEAERTGKTIDEIAKEMSEKDGRSLLMEGFANIGKSIVGVFKAMKEAWAEIFPPVSIVRIYNLIKAFNEFTQNLATTTESGEKLNSTGNKIRRTFKGIFAVLDIISTLVGGGFKIAFEFAKALLEYFDLSILDVTANIGDALVSFRDWIDGCLDFSKAIEVIAPLVGIAAKAIRDLFSSVKNSQLFKDFSTYLKSSFDGIKEWIGSLKGKSWSEIAGDIISGLAKGLRNGVPIVFDAIIALAVGVLDTFKKILGIHSPSVEFEGVGTNIIDGLNIGLTKGVSSILNTLAEIAMKILNFIKNINIAETLASFTGVAIAVAVTKISGSIGQAISSFASLTDQIGEVFDGIGDMFEGIGSMFKAKAWESRAEAIKSLAIAIGIMAASVYVLAKLDAGQLWGAILAIAALSGIIIGLSVVINKLGLSESVKLGKFSGILVGLSVSLFILASAMKKLSDLSWGDLARGGVAIVTMSGILVGLMAATKLIGPGVNKLGGTLIKASLAILLLAFVAKQVASIDSKAMLNGGVAILALGGVFVALTGLTNLVGKGATGIGSTLLKMSVAILILVAMAKILSAMNTESLIKGGIAIAAFGGIIVGLMAATRLAGGNTKGISSTLIGISVAIAIMAVVVGLLSRIEPSGIAKGVIAITAFGGIITGLIAATRLAKGHVKGVATTLLAMAVAIGVLALVATLLSFIEVNKLAKGMIAVGLLGGLLALMIMATDKAKACKANLIVMTVAIAVMAASIAALSNIDGTGLAGATAALSTIMLVFTLLISVSGKAQASIWSLITMTLAVGLLAVVLSQIAKLEVESVMSSAIALSALILAVTGAFAMLSLVNTFGGASLKGILLLTAMAIPLIAFVGVLAVMQHVNDVLPNVLSLVTLITTMTLLMIPLTLIGALWPAALIGIGALTLMGVPLIAFVGILAVMQNVNDVMPNVEALIKLMTTMTSILTVLAVIGPLALIGVGAMTVLTALIVGIGALVVGVGALVEKFPQLQSFIDTGLPLLERLASGIGKMLGNFVGGIVDGVAASLPNLGAQLSLFMTNATPFINGVKMVDASVLAGVGVLAGCVVALTAADLIAGIASFVQGGSSFATLGTELSQFMINAQPFIAGATLLNENMIGGVKALAETILILTAANVLEGLTSWFTGGSSLAAFGEQLPTLGTHLSQFATNLGTFGPDQIQTVTCAANAIKAMAEAADQIPNSGGWLGKIIGENDIGTFGAQLGPLGTNLSQFATNLGTFGEDQITTVDCAARAIKVISEAAAEIPNSGGWLAKIVGDNDIATFAGNLPTLGTNLSLFAANLGTFGEDQISTVDCAARAIGAIAKAAESIPNEGGWIAKLVGDNDIGTFGEKLPGLGEDLKGFADSVGTFGEGQIASVNSAVKALAAFADLADCDLKAAQKNIGDFGDKLPGLGKDVASFSSEMTKVNTSSVTSAATNLKTLANAIVNLEGVNKNAANNFSDAIKTLSKTALDKFVETFTSTASKTSVKNATADLMTKAKEGFESKLEALKKAVSTIVSDAAAAIKSKTNYTTFYNAGSYLVDGFADGISQNDYKAAAKARAMAKAAAQAAEDELGIQSPSKVGYGIGGFFGLGFVNAIRDYADVSYKASRGMAESAHTGLNDAMNSASDAFNEALSSQPTIRPVIDLSAVRTGADAIGDMLDMGTSIGVLSRVGAIGSAINHRNQNGDNSDVVSELKKLGKKLDNVGSTTNNFGDFTYDDGSNITEAIKTLTRAAKMERRV